MRSTTSFAPAPPSDPDAEDPARRREPSTSAGAVIDLEPSSHQTASAEPRIATSHETVVDSGLRVETVTGLGSRSDADGWSTLERDSTNGSMPRVDVGPSTALEPDGEGLDRCAAEDLHVLERLVVADRWGRFTPGSKIPTIGQAISIGQPIGTVGDTPVCSAFSGTVAGWLAVPGEQVRTAQPLLWLRVAS
jgi:hypothetical protein